jgi:hypothetical protein
MQICTSVEVAKAWSNPLEAVDGGARFYAGLLLGLWRIAEQGWVRNNGSMQL